MKGNIARMRDTAKRHRNKTIKKGSLHRLKSQIACILIAMPVLPALISCAVQTDAAVNPIVINEVVTSSSHPLLSDETGSPDWIELKNVSAREMNLSGYKLTNDLKTVDKFVFPDTKIPAGGYLLVLAEKGSNKNFCCTGFPLSKKGETLYLIGPSNQTLGELKIPELPSNASYARRDDGTYGYCTATTPGADNKNVLDENELSALLKTAGLKINEVLPKPQEPYPWAEIYNAGQTEIALNNYCLTDNKDDPFKWQFPERTLKPGEYAVVYFAGNDENTSEMSASFGLGSSDNGLFLYNLTGELISGLTWKENIPYEISAVADNTYSASPTKGQENAKEVFTFGEQSDMGQNDPVRLNEVLPKNKCSIADQEGDRTGWVELYNNSAEPVSLSGYFLSDNEKELFKWPFPDVTVPAKGYITVFLSAKQYKEGELHASFRLAGDETAVYLTDFKRMHVDKLEIPQDLASDISVSRNEQGIIQYHAQPTPGSANAKGFETLKQLLS